MTGCLPLIEVLLGEITKSQVGLIVNASNTTLLGGSSVDSAKHRASGIAFLKDCQKIRNRQVGCKVSEAIITTVGNLLTKFVIHAVGA